MYNLISISARGVSALRFVFKEEFYDHIRQSNAN